MAKIFKLTRKQTDETEEKIRKKYFKFKMFDDDFDDNISRMIGKIRKGGFIEKMLEEENDDRERDS